MSESTIVIKPRSRNLREIRVNTTQKTRVLDIKEQYAKVHKLDPNRIKLSKVDESGKSKSKQLTLDYRGSVESNQLKDEDIVYAKDLGPQISWRLVFFLEYLGPMIINTIFYYVVYDGTQVTWTQNAAYVLVMLHFLKREYETVFVHQFSLSTMPLFNLFKNSGHYWILSGVNFGWAIYHNNNYRESKLAKFFFHVRDCPDDQLILYMILFALAEFGNYRCHIILKELRSDGSTAHKIPYGFLFEKVTCPNYFFESLAWFIFCIITNNWSAWLFFVVASGQMFLWAVKKHKNLKKEFPDYPKNRKIMVPYVI